MSDKHSAASRKRWAKVPKAERSKRMAKLASQRMQSLSPLARKRIANSLVRARAKKRESAV